jgi:prepilin-type N-terminal cleavage/methylation domain-containing protein
MKRKSGFSLIEVLVVIVIASVLMAIVVPRYGSIVGAMNLRSAKQEIAAVMAQARGTAIQTGRTVRVVRSTNLVSLITDVGAGPVIVTQLDLGAQFGVTVSSTTDTVAYDSRGLVIGNSGTIKFVVSKGTARDSMCLMALGKISPTGCSL